MTKSLSLTLSLLFISLLISRVSFADDCPNRGKTHDEVVDSLTKQFNPNSGNIKSTGYTLDTGCWSKEGDFYTIRLYHFTDGIRDGGTMFGVIDGMCKYSNGTSSAQELESGQGDCKTQEEADDEGDQKTAAAPGAQGTGEINNNGNPIPICYSHQEKNLTYNGFKKIMEIDQIHGYLKNPETKYCEAFTILSREKRHGNAMAEDGDNSGAKGLDSPFVKNCLTKTKSEYSSWIKIMKTAYGQRVTKGTKGKGAPQSLKREIITEGVFSPVYEKIEAVRKRQLDSIYSIDPDDEHLLQQLAEQCDQAIQAGGDPGVLKQINDQWTNSCHMTENIPQGEIITYMNNMVASALQDTSFGEEPFIIKIYENKSPKSPQLKKLQEAYQKENREVKECFGGMFLTLERWIEKGEFSEEGLLTGPAVKTFDGQIICNDIGPEAVDYDECVSFVNAYNYSEAIKIGGDAAAKLMIENAKTNAILNADPTDPTYVLKQQVEALKGEKNAAVAQLTALTIRSTLLAGYAKIGWPSHHEMIKGCKDTLDTIEGEGDPPEKLILRYKNANNKILKNYKIGYDHEKDCQSAMSQLTIYPNQGAREAAGVLALKMGVEAAAAGVKAGMAANNVNKMEDAIDKIDTELAETEQEDIFTDMKLGPCATNPESEECKAGNYSTGVNMANPVINSGTSVTGVSRGESLVDQEATTDSAVANNDSGGDAADTFSSSPNTNRSGSGGVKGAPRGAKMVSGGSLGGGGGGGGAGGGSASTGAAQGGQRQASANTSEARSGRRLKFSNSDSKKLGFTGGSGVGSRGKSRRKVKNPLAALMGKKKRGSKTQRYARGAASLGKKGGNIFDQISNRYQDVKGKKRLLEYVPR